MSTGLVHNFGGPSRPRILLAAGVVPPQLETLSTVDWLPRPGRFFADSLCEALGLVEVADPHPALAQATEAALERAKAPAAAVAHPRQSMGTGGPNLGSFDGAPEWVPPPAVVLDRALVVAVLSRTSGSLFLRARSPRLDEPSLCGGRSFVVGTFLRHL